VDCAGNVAVNQERAWLTGGKRHITTLAGTQRKTAEVALYRKPMRLNCIIVYDMNRNVSPQRDIHYGQEPLWNLLPLNPTFIPSLAITTEK
jgi:predicted transglutaminase-like cysteine proteinase